jgi:hypothetical protein
MPERLIQTYELFARLFPYVLGLFVSVGYQDDLAKLIITPISMLLGALLVHFFKPIIVRWINKLKKN